ncbi:MAG TPA: FtsK/SpoIIIE domain-containing protein, partial [Beutenbergiaceae bacterium]|nr:FtsK/SpoIIIE domain-containing protein [Beutenbergiaceae bacterium]
TAAPTPGSQPNITPSATAPFNRPPRLGQRVQPDPLVPPAPREVSQPTKFNVIASLAPIVMAVVLVMVLGSLRFALFALLTPVVAVATYIDSRHRYRKNLEEEEKRFSAALVEFGQEIERAGELETRHLLSVAPDPAVVLRRPRLPSVELWHRRYGDGKFLLLNAGIGDVPWTPRVEGEPNTRHDERVKHVLANARRIGAPVMVSLDDAGVVGIVGDRTHALGLARNLLTQVGVHCGPADVMMSVFCDDGVEHEWAWCSWLPHTRNAASSEGARWMSHDHQASVSMIRGLLDNVAGLPTPAMVMVIDSVKLTEGRDAPARDLLGYGRGAHPRPGEQPPRKVSGIVIAQSAEQLPAACTTVIDVDAEGSATVVYDDAVGEVPDVVVAGISSHDAGEAARRLAQFEDPELVIPGATLPSLIQLDELLGVEEMNAAAIEHLWDSTQGISAPVGMGESGPLHLDIVRDGPHGLVGGTTGSGKSEFLRSYVAGLAAQNDPTVLNFILIDFKGGAAFTACERLPHTIGTISNLDEQLADRALRALEAEMERRQRLFAQAGEDIDNLPAYWDTNPAEPLPRLLVVIDEFAMLAKDFPDVLASLVSVAAVGRTLGVHMILATQRPAGVVNDDILANTNLRVALRVQSREDSSNVIDVPHAASISRTQMGRAYVKLGQDEILPIQTALVTGQTQDEAAADIDFAHTTVFGAPIPTPHLSQPKSTDDNDLDVLIDAVVEANNNRGIAPPRQVWPEALGEKVSLNGYHASRAKTDDAYPQPDVGGVHQQVVEAVLVDEPDLQRQRPHGWDLSQGNLLLLGIPGSGCSTTLVTLGLSIASTLSPDEVDLVCLDMGRDLAPLSNLPHVAGFVGPGPSAQERRLRFFRFLHTELERRKTTP